MALKDPILMLGSGQLGLMIAAAAARLGLVLDCYDPENDKLMPGTSNFRCDTDWESTINRYSAITVEREAFPSSGLSARLAASDKCVAKGALSVIPDRFNQKSMLDRLGIATAPWVTFDTPEDFTQARAQFGDVVIKTRSGGYDGRGTWLIKQQDSLDDVPLDKLAGNAIVEKMMPFRRELSIVGARSLAGDTVFYPLVCNWHVDGTLRLTIAPASQAQSMQQEAEHALTRIMNELDFYGVMAVEFFEVDGQLQVNEIAPRVHNSGHWTQEGADWSQFDLHAIALTDLPLVSPTVSGYTAMINLIGVEWQDAWLTRPGVLHWYGKSYRPGRKLGHVNVVADTLDGLRSQLDAWRDVQPVGYEKTLADEIQLS